MTGVANVVVLGNSSLLLTTLRLLDTNDNGIRYYSNIYVDSSNRKVDCLWIDGNNDQPQTGFQVHWPEFVNKDGEQLPSDENAMADKVDYLCNGGPPFKMYKYDDVKDPRGITYWVLDHKRSESGSDDRKIGMSYAPPKYPTSAKFGRDLGRNGTALRPDSLGRARVQVFLSRRALLERYASAMPRLRRVEEPT